MIKFTRSLDHFHAAKLKNADDMVIRFLIKFELNLDHSSTL